MKNQIPQFLQEQLNNKNARPQFFPDEMKQFILDYGNFYNYPNTKNLNENKLISLWFRYMKSGISEIGTCDYTNCSKPNRIVNNSKTNGFLVSRGCCSGHSGKIVMMENYGVENPMHLENSKKKLKDTLMENYGVDNPMKLVTIQNKHKKIMMEKYGVDNLFKNPSIAKKAMLSKYGVENPSQLLEIQEKKKNNNYERTGYFHHMQNPKEFEKNQDNGYKRKEYIWKTGEVSMVQGYEPIVLKELEEAGYSFNEILTSPKDMPEIFYFFEDSKHRYYPDIFIPEENIIIEVKSKYTLDKEWDKNQAKFEATKNAGFGFKLEVR